MIRNKRIGKVKLTTDLIENKPELVHLMFSKFIPVRAEMIWHEGYIEYIGISDLFEERGEGESVPEYAFEITQIDNNGGAIVSGVTKY